MKHAFTLVEMLVAMALGTLLMVSLMGLAARLPAATRAMEAAEQTPAWVRPVFESLRHDLARAREIRQRGQVVELEMPPTVQDGESGTPQARQIRWEIRRTGPAPMLVRTESSLSAGLRKDLDRKLAAMNIETFAVTLKETNDSGSDIVHSCALLSITDARSHRTYEQTVVLE